MKVAKALSYIPAFSTYTYTCIGNEFDFALNRSKVNLGSSFEFMRTMLYNKI